MSMEHSCKNEIYTCRRCGKQLPIGKGCRCLANDIEKKFKPERNKKEQE